MGATVCVLVAWVYQGRAFAAFRAPSNAYFAHDPLARSLAARAAHHVAPSRPGRGGVRCVVLPQRSWGGHHSRRETAMVNAQWHGAMVR